MMDSVHYEIGSQKCQMRTSAHSDTKSTKWEEPPEGTGKVLCSHDGVLLKKTSVEYISDLNTSGCLSIVEYAPPRRLYIEWHPNDNIMIADDSQDQGDWALVDTISRRSRTTSECKVFNTKPAELCAKPQILRTSLECLASIEVMNRRQVIRFVSKVDVSPPQPLHSEFFFQHGNAEQFVNAMRQMHIIEIPTGGSRNSHGNGEVYIILNTEKQKLKKTFAELDIGEIKASSVGGEGWFQKFSLFAEFVSPHNRLPKIRPGSLDDQKDQTTSPSSMESYQEITMNDSNKSCIENELENMKEVDEKIVNMLPERHTVERGLPLNEAQWLEFRTSDGCISDATRVKEIIFRGGIHPHLRAEVWKYLLNYYHWDDTVVERLHRRGEKSKEYFTMKEQWLSMTTTQEENFTDYCSRKNKIEKDVHRTDRELDYFAGDDNPNLVRLNGILLTYVMYNFDLGYVQGMSDLLAPILAIQGDEVDSFWCFVGFMNMIFPNFAKDQAAIKTQFLQLRRLLEFANPRLFNYIVTHDSDNMFFCFRWLLVWFKREFHINDVLKLWECLWTGLPCPNFQLLIAVAILDQETDIIIECNYDFNDILKHVNELSGQIDSTHILELAEAIYMQIKSAEHLPNDVRQIIGEPLLDNGIENDMVVDESFEVLGRERSPEEKQRDELLEEQCERSLLVHHT